MPETVIQCPPAPDPCTVTVVHTLDWNGVLAPITEEQVGDYLALWGAFLVAGVAILCGKAIYNRFRIDHER